MAIADYFDGAKTTPLELSDDERARHLYVVGRSGTGKSTLLHNLALSDIENGYGVCVIDPHGDLATELIDSIPESRTNDVCYLDATDLQNPVSFNPLAGIHKDSIALVASNTVSSVRSVYPDSWGPRLEWFLYCALALLLDKGYATFDDLPRLFYDNQFRAKKLQNITDPKVMEFWTREYPSYNQKYREDASGPILNKIGQLVASPHLRNILCRPHPKVNIPELIDKQRILIVNLSKGQIGDAPSSLLGSLVINSIKHAVLAQTHDRKPFFLLVDEFQSFTTTTFATLLSEARKYKLSLTLAHQFTTQLPEQTRDAVLGNVGTIIAFRVGTQDAELLADEFHPLDSHELSDQQPFHAWIKRGLYLTRHPIKTTDKMPPNGRSKTVREQSRRRYATSSPK